MCEGICVKNLQCQYEEGKVLSGSGEERSNVWGNMSLQTLYC